MLPSNCPKFNKCSAALCPLDAQWKIRSMTPGDSICFYLSEGVKAGAEARFDGVSDEGIFNQARVALPEMIASSNTLKRRLERAAKNGSRVDAIKRLTSHNTTRRNECDTAPQPEIIQSCTAQVA